MIFIALVLGAICPSIQPGLVLDETWRAPDELPIARVHAWVYHQGEQWVGGLGGLYRGKPYAWKRVDDRPVKDIGENGALWVLYGDGSVDKIEPAVDRLYFDVMKGAAKRPWVSCIGNGWTKFGGQGGWIDRSNTTIKETYPKELGGDVVTVLYENGSYLFAGTQKKGLFRILGGKMERFGFAGGLPDSWVTAMTWVKGGTFAVGLADGGVVTGTGPFNPLAQPVQKVRKLINFEGKLVVGGMDGCWIGDVKGGWQKLSDEETTCLVVHGGRLGVGTPRGLSWWIVR